MPQRFRRIVVIWVAVAATALSPAFAQEAKKSVRRPRAMLMALGFSRDGSMLVSGGDAVRVHALESGEMLHEARAGGLTRAVAFSPAEKDVFVSGGQDALVRFWRLKWNRPFRTLKEHKAAVTALVYSPDGKLLASAAAGSENGKLARGEFRLWDTESGELVRSENFRDGGVFSVAFSSDGKQVAFAHSSTEAQPGSAVEVFDVPSWKKVRSITFPPGFAYGLTFFPGGEQLLIVGGECVPNAGGGCVPAGRAWIAREGAKEAADLNELGVLGYLHGAALVDSGKLFVTGTTVLEKPDESRMIPDLELRDAQTGNLVWSQQEEGGDSMYGASVSPNGKLFAGCTASTILVFDTSTRKLKHAIGVGD